MKTTLLPLFLLFCLFFFSKITFAQIPNLVISEIMYNPPEDGADSLEFLEIYNNELTAIDLEGIHFVQGITHTFPNLILPPQSYLVLAKDSIAFQNVFGLGAIQWDGGTLINAGETLKLVTANLEMIDSVTFQNILPWATAADGLGASLVLCDVESDNNMSTNWESAFTATGFYSNNLEIIANPFAASDCPTGPIISFLGNSISVIEEDIFVNLQVAIERGNNAITEVEFNFENNSSAVLDIDFSSPSPLPLLVSFPAGIEKDTQVVSIQVLENFDIEANRFANFILQNPTNGAIINPMHRNFQLVIEDDDATLPKLIISEIMYNPPEIGFDSTEFVELYNNDTLAINLVDYTFTQGIEFTFPEIILEPGEYLAIARDSEAFARYYGLTSLQWMSGTLVNGGEILELRNPGGNVADVVEYDNTAQWSLAADGGGASLVLCDFDADNSSPDAWEASISPTGIIIDGKEIFADPLAESDCFIPLSLFPNRTIGEMRGVDGDGILDSLNKKCTLQGVVNGRNWNAVNGGLKMIIMDGNGDGITVYSSDNNFGYTVELGDEILVEGTIIQFNGLAEIVPDTLWKISDNNILTNPLEVTFLNESTESKLLLIKNLSIVNPADWDNNDPLGFNVEVTDGTNFYEMRIDNEVDLYDSPVPDFSFNLTGFGGQYDLEIPFLEGYQILPRSVEDLEMITDVEEFIVDFPFEIYPNPVDDFLFLKMGKGVERILVRNSIGQDIFEIGQSELDLEIDCREWVTGVYFVSVFTNNKKFTTKIIKL